MDKSLPFGKHFTDHMFEIEWNADSGFSAPSISPHHPLSLDPAVPALHYAVQCFEGLVAVQQQLDDDLDYEWKRVLFLAIR
jgi:hypothetical protein